MSETNLYSTAGLLRKAGADIVTSDSANAYNTLDGNLNTVWTPAGLSAEGIVFDLNGVEVEGYNGFAIWIANYDGNDFSYGQVKLDGGATVGSTTNAIVPYTDIDHEGGPLFFALNANSFTYRYVKITFNSMPASGDGIQIGQFWLLKNRGFDRKADRANSQKWPVPANIESELPGFDNLVKAEALHPVYRFSKGYHLIGSVQIANMENFLEDCQGSRYPFIFQEDTGILNAYVCRLEDDEVILQNLDYDFKYAALKFKTLKYIRDGEVY